LEAHRCIGFSLSKRLFSATLLCEKCGADELKYRSGGFMLEFLDCLLAGGKLSAINARFVRFKNKTNHKANFAQGMRTGCE
jgi:hypothetical protein